LRETADSGEARASAKDGIVEEKAQEKLAEFDKFVN
jgi:hypothetical protein